MTHGGRLATRGDDRRAAKTRAQGAAPAQPLAALFTSPEFLIRRAHQIATAVFTETCAEIDLTPSQYSVLFALRERAPIGQNELGRLVALDRSTTSLVVRILRDRGLVAASADDSDRRKSFLELTNDGRLLLARAERLNSKSSQALMSAFDPHQASAFIALLDRLTSTLDVGTARAPEAPASPPAPAKQPASAPPPKAGEPKANDDSF